MLIAALGRLSTFGYIRISKARSLAGEFASRMRIRMSSSRQSIKFLSGGNQQKAVLSKWLLVNPRILILDEPTRGIDVGAKAEIYELINELRESGVAIIMISSELPELLGMSDRVCVMAGGRVQATMNAADASPRT
jgi:ABC-type sugar transport system ATPase subunit